MSTSKNEMERSKEVEIREERGPEKWVDYAMAIAVMKMLEPKALVPATIKCDVAECQVVRVVPKPVYVEYPVMIIGRIEAPFAYSADGYLGTEDYIAGTLEVVKSGGG